MPDRTPPEPVEARDLTADLWTHVGAFGQAIAKAWSLSGRSAPLIEPDEWDGMAATLLAVLSTEHGLALRADTARVPEDNPYIVGSEPWLAYEECVDKYVASLDRAALATSPERSEDETE